MPDAARPPEDMSTPSADIETTAGFDYAAPADLFTRREVAAAIAAGTSRADADRARSRSAHRNRLAYRRFPSSPETIRFAIEKLTPQGLPTAVLLVDGARHEAETIRDLYARPDYPLPRRPAGRSA